MLVRVQGAAERLDTPIKNKKLTALAHKVNRLMANSRIPDSFIGVASHPRVSANDNRGQSRRVSRDYTDYTELGIYRLDSSDEEGLGID